MQVPTTGNGDSLSRTSSTLSELEESQQLPSTAFTGLDASDGAGDGASASQMEVDDSEPLAGQAGDTDMAPLNDPLSYSNRVAARLALLKSAVPSHSNYRSYSFQPVLAIPQTTVNVHALALPPCASHLYTSGSDGFIRRYAWYPSLRMSQPQPVLKSYWENPTVAALEAVSPSDVSKARFGPAGVSSLAGNTAPVHSLAVQREELYTLAGSAEGVINLFSTRIDEGQCRASLGLDKSGHTRGQPVSVLALNETNSTLLSGGWDNKLLQWDLNTGVCSRKFEGHKAQLTATQFRPDNTAIAIMTPAAQDDVDLEQSGEAHSDRVSGDAKTDSVADKDTDAQSENSYDPLFDDDNDGPEQMGEQGVDAEGEVNDLSTASAPSAGLSLPGLTLPTAPVPSTSQPSKQAAGAPAAAKLPEVQRVPLPSFHDAGSPQLGEDVFMSAALDGECLIWDRRAATKEVRRLDIPKGSAPWTISACWSPDAMSVYVGRRDASLDVYDLRTRRSRHISLPNASGSITSIASMSHTRQVLLASSDTVRLWDPQRNTFTIASEVQAGATSFVTDMRGSYLFAANGGKGWVEKGPQEVGCFKIVGKQ